MSASFLALFRSFKISARFFSFAACLFLFHPLFCPLGFGCILIAFFATRVFMRMKLPGYMMN